jgi:hypothetical protein
MRLTEIPTLKRPGREFDHYGDAAALGEFWPSCIFALMHFEHILDNRCNGINRMGAPSAGTRKFRRAGIGS